MHRDWRPRSTAADSVSDRGRDGLDGGTGDGGRAQPDAGPYWGGYGGAVANRVGGFPIYTIGFFHIHAGCLDANGRCHAFCQTYTVTANTDPVTVTEYDTCPDRAAHVGPDPSTHSRAHDGSYA